MSVLACGRTNCENIMCSQTILNGEMYICSDCWNELLYVKATWTGKDITISDIKGLIEDFMEKGREANVVRNNWQEIDDEFQRLTEY